MVESELKPWATGNSKWKLPSADSQRRVAFEIIVLSFLIENGGPL